MKWVLPLRINATRTFSPGQSCLEDISRQKIIERSGRTSQLNHGLISSEIFIQTLVVVVFFTITGQARDFPPRHLSCSQKVFPGPDLEPMQSRRAPLTINSCRTASLPKTVDQQSMLNTILADQSTVQPKCARTYMQHHCGKEEFNR